MENPTSHVIDAQSTAGAVALPFKITLTTGAFLENRKRKMAPSRDHFGPEFVRSLHRPRALSEARGWLADRHAASHPSVFVIQNPTSQRQDTAAQLGGIATSIDY